MLLSVLAVCSEYLLMLVAASFYLTCGEILVPSYLCAVTFLSLACLPLRGKRASIRTATKVLLLSLASCAQLSFYLCLLLSNVVSTFGA
jgi:hypothetical protein